MGSHNGRIINVEIEEDLGLDILSIIISNLLISIMNETIKKKLFVQLQFCTLLLVSTLLPDFGSVASSLFGMDGLSFTVIACRIIGLLGASIAYYPIDDGSQFATPLISVYPLVAPCRAWTTRLQRSF